MCNLYSLTKGQAAIRDLFRARHDRTGNLPLFPGIFPDQRAPIVRNGVDGERELVLARLEADMADALALQRAAKRCAADRCKRGERGWRRSMIRIAITAAAYEAIKATLPLGTVGYEAKRTDQGEVLLWLERRALDRLDALRQPGDGYSEIILRMAAMESCGPAGGEAGSDAALSRNQAAPAR
jgi:hypothetical protein